MPVCLTDDAEFYEIQSPTNTQSSLDRLRIQTIYPQHFAALITTRGGQLHILPIRLRLLSDLSLNQSLASPVEQFWGWRLYQRLDHLVQRIEQPAKLQESSVVGALLETFAWQSCLTATDVNFLCVAAEFSSTGTGERRGGGEARLFSHSWTLDLHTQSTRHLGLHASGVGNSIEYGAAEPQRSEYFTQLDSVAGRILALLAPARRSS